MPGTLLPIVLLPEQVFTQAPFGLTMEGQYIVKNMVLIAAALVIGATVGGASIRTPPGHRSRTFERLGDHSTGEGPRETLNAHLP
jgi:hypothetical protein